MPVATTPGEILVEAIVSGLIKVTLDDLAVVLGLFIVCDTRLRERFFRATSLLIPRLAESSRVSIPAHPWKALLPMEVSVAGRETGSELAPSSVQSLNDRSPMAAIVAGKLRDSSPED